MAESPDSEDGIISLNEESRVVLSDENQVVPQESQLAQPFHENQRSAAVLIPSFNLNEGNFEKPNFGPVTKTKHVEANKIDHATIIHHHHNYPAGQHGPSEEEEKLPYAPDAGLTRTTKGKQRNPKAKTENVIPEGYVEISEDIYMYTKEPIKKGTNVYKGFQLHITGQKQSVAIKRIYPCDEKSIREVEHLVNLSPHPNVVQILRSKVYESLTHKELYIVMELCKEQNLRDYLNELREKNKPLDLKQAMVMAEQLIDAIEHIHQNEIIHGDLKLENILFSSDSGQIKVSDFGISKQLKDSRSKTKLTGLGTDGYRAPETYSSEHISKSADVYSLGIILFSLFTVGEHPYGKNQHLWIHHITQNINLDLSGLPKEMWPMRGIVMELLVKIFQLDPKKRPTIQEVAILLFRQSSKTNATKTKSSLQRPGAKRQTASPKSHSKSPQRSDANSVTASADSKSPLRYDANSPTVSTDLKPPRRSDPNPPTLATSPKSHRRYDSDPPRSYTYPRFLQRPYVTPPTGLTYRTLPRRSAAKPSTASTYPNPFQISHTMPSKAHFNPRFPQSSEGSPLTTATYPRPPQKSDESSRMTAAYPTFPQGSDPLVLGRISDVSIGHNKLELHVTRSSQSLDILIPNIDSGCRIYSYPEQTSSKSSALPQLGIEINGCQRSIHDLHTINVHVPWSRELWPGVAIWLDRETQTLVAYNLCDGSQKIQFRNECYANPRYKLYFPQNFDPRSEFSLLPVHARIPILSIDRYIEFVEREKRQKSLEVLPGVEFHISFGIYKYELCRITPRFRGESTFTSK